MPDMAPENETELEAQCLLFLQAAGRDPRDAVALGTALSPLVPVIRSWVLAKIRQKRGVPRRARGRCEPEDIALTVLCRLQERPPTDRALEGRAVARLHDWVNRVTDNILKDLDRAAVSRRELAHGGERDPVVLARADEDCEPEQILAQDDPTSRLDFVVSVMPGDLVTGKPRLLLEKELENVRRIPPLTDAGLAMELGVTIEYLYQLRCRYLSKTRAWWAKNKQYYQ